MKPRKGWTSCLLLKRCATRLAPCPTWGGRTHRGPAGNRQHKNTRRRQEPRRAYTRKIGAICAATSGSHVELVCTPGEGAQTQNKRHNISTVTLLAAENCVRLDQQFFRRLAKKFVNVEKKRDETDMTSRCEGSQGGLCDPLAGLEGRRVHHHRELRVVQASSEGGTGERDSKRQKTENNRVARPGKKPWWTFSGRFRSIERRVHIDRFVCLH